MWHHKDLEANVLATLPEANPKSQLSHKAVKIRLTLFLDGYQCVYFSDWYLITFISGHNCSRVSQPPGGECSGATRSRRRWWRNTPTANRTCGKSMRRTLELGTKGNDPGKIYPVHWNCQLWAMINWLFHWDFLMDDTSDQWGYKHLQVVKGHNCG